MPCCSKPTWERFARLIVSGKTNVQAYKAIGGTAKHPESAASAIRTNPEVASRIVELLARSTQAAIKRVALTKEWILENLMENVHKAMQVKGGSSVANRGLELLGNHLDMWHAPAERLPLKLEDLPAETLTNMLAEAEAEVARQKEATTTEAAKTAAARTKVVGIDQPRAEPPAPGS